MRRILRAVAAGALLTRERWRSGVAYNLLSARVAQDPYPTFARLRARDPVHRSLLLKGWLLTRYEDVDAVLRDHRRFSSDPLRRNSGHRRSAPLTPDEATMLFLDPPDHTRLRSLVNRAFTRTAINALEARIRGIMEALLDDVDDPASFDLMKTVAGPLPVTVIAEMLGVPPRDRPRFKTWSDQRARLLEPTVSAREREVAAQATRSLEDYLLPIIKARRAEPRDDIISVLAQAEEEGDALSEREMLNMLRLLLVAGNETTTNLIGNGMLALLRHPEQLDALRRDPGLIPRAVEELLRYDSPVQAGLRAALDDCEVNGVPVRRGEDLILLIGAANRDPEAFAQPDRLDVERDERSHVAFGRGIHHCLGAPLARLEGRIAIEALLTRYSSLRLLDERPLFHHSIVLRGLKRLPVAARRVV